MEAFSDDLTCIGNENKCGRFFVFDKITEPDSLRAVQCREDDVFVFSCLLYTSDAADEL